VVSTFWPYWLAGEMVPAVRREIPGDTVDGYAREYACAPAFLPESAARPDPCRVGDAPLRRSHRLESASDVRSREAGQRPLSLAS
jgi:hypothetical protein